MNSKLRIVRHVGKHRDGRTRSLTFAIRRRSWTRRPTTVYNRVDLYRCELVLVKKDYGLVHSSLEARLQNDIDFNLRTLTYADVVGVVE